MTALSPPLSPPSSSQGLAADPCATGQPSLQAAGLSYRVADGKALVADVSFSLSGGAMVAIAGPNGAGKTTLLRMLAGLLPPSEGEVYLFGRPLADYSPRARALRIAYVGQRDTPDHRLSLAQYVALGRIPHGGGASRGQDRRIVAEALDAVGLGDKTAARLGQLSGGELQRAGIARALSQEPEILFLDEPTNHLDPKAKGVLLSLLLARGITCVCVLHDLALIPKLASHTLLMNEGRLVGAGRTEEVLTAQSVHQVFGVDFLHLTHPTEDRSLPVLDIPVAAPRPPLQ